MRFFATYCEFFAFCSQEVLDEERKTVWHECIGCIYSVTKSLEDREEKKKICECVSCKKVPMCAWKEHWNSRRTIKEEDVKDELVRVQFRCFTTLKHLLYLFCCISICFLYENIKYVFNVFLHVIHGFHGYAYTSCHSWMIYSSHHRCNNYPQWL